MCYAKDVSVQQRGASRLPHARRAPSPRALLAALGLTAIAAAGLGLVLYFASTSIAWFATSPTTDARFGTLNDCLMSHAPEGRAGFSVAHDGSAVATFTGAGIAVCTRSADRAEGRFVPLAGVTRLAFDGARNLWIATGGSREAEAALWRLAPITDMPERVAEEAAVALTGHASGVVALDAAGRMISFTATGDSRGFAEAPRVPEPRLSSDVAGELIALAGGGAWWVYRAADLHPVLREAPCQVEYVWWTRQPGRALVACGPGASWALEIDAHTGARQEAPRRERTRSVLIPKLQTYVVPCEGLPCEAPLP
jgi:hypothetical protein